MNAASTCIGQEQMIMPTAQAFRDLILPHEIVMTRHELLHADRARRPSSASWLWVLSCVMVTPYLNCDVSRRCTALSAASMPKSKGLRLG